MHTLIQKTLDMLTRLLHVDVRYFARGGAWLAGGQFFMSGMAMISAIAFANLLPEETFGHYRFVLSLVGIVGIASLSGMDTALIRSASRGFERTLVPILTRKILFGLFGTIGSLGLALHYWTNDNTLLASAFLLCAVFFPFKDSLKIYDALLQARRRFGLVTQYRVFTHAISLSALILTMFWTDELLPLLGAYFLPVILVELFLLVRTLRTTPLTGMIDQNALRYGYHLSFLRGMVGIAYNIQTVAMFHLLGPVSVALYYFALAPTEQARTLIGHAQTLLFPKTSKDTWHVGSYASFMRKILPFIGVITLGTAVFATIIPILFSIFFPAYMHAATFAQIYAPTIIITAFNTVTHSIITSKGSVRTQYLLSFVDIVLQFTLVVPLIYYFGIPGAITGVYITKIIEAVLLFTRLFVYPRITHTAPL